MSLLCVALLGWWSWSRSVSGAGHAFDATLAGIATTQPIKAGSFAVFGSVALRNIEDHPVHLQSVEPVYADNVSVANTGISPYGPNVPLSNIDVHVSGASEIPGFVVPPSSRITDHLYGVTIEVRLNPGAHAGVVIGLDVRYRDGTRARTQRFSMVNVVCRWIGEVPDPCPTTYRGRDVYHANPAEVVEEFAARGRD